MLRQVRLPLDIRGSLFLSAMPGRRESFRQFIQMASGHNVTRVVRLTSLDEVRAKSPDYYEALMEGKTPWQVIECAVEDYGIPANEGAFVTTVQVTADWLRGGDNVLVHCGAGIGRTGMLAVCILVALGVPVGPAEKSVSASGSGPETDEQRALVRRISFRLSR